MASQEHDGAVQRPKAALVEQDRLDERFDAAIGTSTEFGAYVRLRAAGDQVTAREAWVNWVDDEGYRGLNAGPFELLAESRETRFAAKDGPPESGSPRCRTSVVSAAASGSSAAEPVPLGPVRAVGGT